MQVVDQESYDPKTNTHRGKWVPWPALANFKLPAIARTSGGVDPECAATMRAVIRGEKPWPLFLYGDVGSGKTCAALVVADWAGEAAYVEVPALCRMLIAADKGEPSDDGDVIHAGNLRRNWKRANVAILDELGSREKVSDFAYETVKWAIDERVNNGLPLILISNCDGAAIAKLYDDRIASRAASGTIVRFTGDRRIK